MKKWAFPVMLLVLAGTVFLLGNRASVMWQNPIFAFGLFKKDGYPLEKYIKIVWKHRFTEQKTLYKTENAIALYMPDEDWGNDLSKKMLAYAGAKTSAERETNITYHLTEKEEKRGLLLALADCRAAGKLHRKSRKLHRKELRTIKRLDRRELAHLQRLNTGKRETNITYHLTEKEERRGPLLALADCRAAAKLHREYLKVHFQK